MVATISQKNDDPKTSNAEAKPNKRKSSKQIPKNGGNKKVIKNDKEAIDVENESGDGQKEDVKPTPATSKGKKAASDKKEKIRNPKNCVEWCNKGNAFA